MLLKYIDGKTMYEVIRPTPTLTRAQKIDSHNQLLDGITHHKRWSKFTQAHGHLQFWRYPAGSARILCWLMPTASG